MKNININANILEDYLFSNVSFSTFKFDELSILACKYYLSKFKFFKKRNLKKMEEFLRKEFPNEQVGEQKIKHLAYQDIKALKNSNILLSNNEKEIKLYQKVKNGKDIIVSRDFSIEDLPLGSEYKAACIFVNNRDEIDNYKEITSFFKKIKVVELDVIKENDVIFDQIKVTLLRDESDIYFVGKSIYANYIVDSIYTVNKIGINL